MARYILLGRIRLYDELSLDRVSWRPAREYSQLFPQELLQLSTWEGYQRLVVARMAVEERAGQRRVRQPADLRPAREERRVSADRRDRAGGEDSPNHPVTNDAPRGADNRLSQPLRMVLLAMLLMSLVLAYFSMSSR